MKKETESNNVTVPVKVGALIAKRRMEISMTQSELASKSGIGNASSISRIERGHISITISTLNILCEALECKSSDILNF